MSYTRILVGLVLGATLGIAANAILGGADRRVEWIVFHITEPAGELFLRLLLMTVIPLVFSSLVVGVSGIGNIRRLGRIGVKCFIYTLIISAISVLIGISLANLVRPGERIDKNTAQALVERYSADASRRVKAAEAQAGPSPSPLMQVVRTLAPSNPIAAAASETPNMIYVMFFAVVLAVAVTLLPVEETRPLIHFFEALFKVSAKIIDIVMWVAPFAVACLLFTTTARFGFDLLRALAWYVVTVLAGLSIHMFGVYSLSVGLLSRISPLEFFRRIRTVMLTAFSTSSSNATLPTAIRVTEENLGVPREINTFVLTVGATINQNGTALYEGVTVLFLAQLAGIPLSLGQQIVVAYSPSWEASARQECRPGRFLSSSSCSPRLA